MTRLTIIAGIALASLALSGCATRERDEAKRAQTALVGIPKQQLLSCAGVPNRTEASGAQEFLTYEYVAGVKRGPSTSIGIGGGSGGFGLGLGLGIPLGGGGPDGCVATFTVDQGRVSRLAYREDIGDPASCYAIVENCLGTSTSQR